MNLIEQLELLHKEELYDEIVSVVENIPNYQDDPDLLLQLARAYNNLGSNEDLSGYQRGLEILKSIEDSCQDNARWHYRIGYSYCMLDEFELANDHLNRAVEIEPEIQDDVNDIFDSINFTINSGFYAKNFKTRVEEFWQTFSDNEAKLKRILLEKRDDSTAREFIENIFKILNHEGMIFEFGLGDKFELLFCLQGNRELVFIYDYIVKKAPKHLLKEWVFSVGVNNDNNSYLTSTADFHYGLEIHPGDVIVKAESTKDVGLSLSIFNEALVPILKSGEVGRVYAALSSLLDQTLGECFMLTNVMDFFVSEEEIEGVRLRDLKAKLEEFGYQVNNSHEPLMNEWRYLDKDIPEEPDPNFEIRQDVFQVKTRLVDLLVEFDENNEESFIHLTQFGVTACTVMYDIIKPEKYYSELIDFRLNLEKEINSVLEDEAVTLGGASGVFCGYMDYLVYDMPGFEKKVTSILKEYGISWAAINPIRKGHVGFVLIDEPSDNLDGEYKNGDSNTPVTYEEEEMDIVGSHIEKTFGHYDNILHEIVSTDVHIDICIIEPSDERNYYSLVTMGMGALDMNTPDEYAEFKRAELAIHLPADWNIHSEEEEWYWPIRWLKIIARLPFDHNTFVGQWHTIPTAEVVSNNSYFMGFILDAPNQIQENTEICTLPNGQSVNFYTLVPVYNNEMNYKLQNGAEALMSELTEFDPNYYIVNINRKALDVNTYTAIDSAYYHLASLREKELPVEEIAAYNHLAIYLRWCMENDLMVEKYNEDFEELIEMVKQNNITIDLREFLHNVFNGSLYLEIFNEEGAKFANYYYGDGDTSDYNYPKDVDNHAFAYFGGRQKEMQTEEYLFVPYDERYYEEMKEYILKAYKEFKEYDEFYSSSSSSVS